MTRITDLAPVDGHKSFYGKAKTIACDDGWTLLKSYGTIVAGMDPHGVKRRLFAGRSATTGRHVVAFFESLGAQLKAKDFFRWPTDANPHVELEEEQ